MSRVPVTVYLDQAAFEALRREAREASVPEHELAERIIRKHLLDGPRSARGELSEEEALEIAAEELRAHREEQRASPGEGPLPGS